MVVNIQLKRHGYIVKSSCRTYGSRLKTFEVWFSDLPTIHCPSLVSRPRTRAVQAFIFMERNNKTVRFKRAKNYGINPIGTDTDVERA